MYRFVTAALGAATLSATVLLAAPAANASTTDGPPRSDAVAGTGLRTFSAPVPAPKPSGPRHHFSASVQGTSIWGDWYTAKGLGKFPIVVEIHLKHTAANNQRAGLAFDFIQAPFEGGKRYGGWYATAMGQGASRYVWWDQATAAHLKIFGMVGYSEPVPGHAGRWTFVYYHRTAWKTIR